MLINQQCHKVRCDIGVCKNQAKFVISDDGVSTRRNLNLCEECVRELYKVLGGVIVPKSPDNILKKGREGLNKKTLKTGVNNGKI